MSRVDRLVLYDCNYRCSDGFQLSKGGLERRLRPIRLALNGLKPGTPGGSIGIYLSFTDLGSLSPAGKIDVRASGNPASESQLRIPGPDPIEPS